MSHDNGNGQKLLTTDLPETDGLSDQQRLFVTEYIRSRNASEAARRAGFKWPAMAGHRLLQKVIIREAIETELRANHVGKDHLLSGYSEVAWVSIADFIDEQGKPVIEKIRANGHLVKSYKCKVNQRRSTREVEVTDAEIVLHDRLAAMSDLAKTQGMFKGDESRIANAIVQVVIQAADAELPREVAGRLLGRIADRLRTMKL
jgi:phage terminase small subunit